MMGKKWPKPNGSRVPARHWGHSWLGTYHYWSPFTYVPVHRKTYRFWHIALWAFLDRKSPLSHWRIARLVTSWLTMHRNAAYTGQTLAEHRDDWRECRW